MISSVIYEDIWSEQMEDLRQEILKTPVLFENTDRYSILTDFLSNYNITPIPGNSYILSSVISFLPSLNLNLAHFDKPHKLIEIKNNRAYFKINGIIKAYPEGSTISGDLLKFTRFFHLMKNLISLKQRFY